MELQLVSKEVALLAKELGFNEICHNIFIKDLNEVSAIRKISIVGMRNDEQQLSSLICTLPEQELLAKWLREVHNLSVDICFNGSESHYWWIKEMKPFGYEEDSTNQEVHGWLTHEEALEDGLAKALSILQSKTNSK